MNFQNYKVKKNLKLTETLYSQLCQLLHSSDLAAVNDTIAGRGIKRPNVLNLIENEATQNISKKSLCPFLEC